MLSTMKINKSNMKDATNSGFMNATDVADYLVQKGLPFRSAHEVVGKMVLYCIQNNTNIENLTIKDFKNFSSFFEDDINEKVEIESCIESKVSQGSTSTKSVAIMIEKGKNFVENLED